MNNEQTKQYEAADDIKGKRLGCLILTVGSVVSWAAIIGLVRFIIHLI